MKNLINLLFVSAFAVSCINLDGLLNVEQSMVVKKKDGFLNLKTEKITLAPGSYRADLKINSQKSFTLKLRLDKKNDKEILIPIKSDDDLNVPENGNVKISGNEISQPFDLAGTIKTEYSNSDTTRDYESCTYTVRNSTRCERVCTTSRSEGRRPETRCDNICRDVVITVNGSRMVEYHTRYTSRKLNVSFKDTTSKAKLASFTANGTESQRVNDYTGECR